MGVLHGIFEICKFVFGLGALFGLLGVGFMMLWFLGHVVVQLALRNQPSEYCAGLRKLFLES
jgi:hypothetical protein